MVLNEEMFRVIIKFANKNSAALRKWLSKRAKLLKGGKKADATPKQEFIKRSFSSFFALMLYFFIVGFGGCVYIFAILLLAMLCVFEIYRATHKEESQDPRSFLNCVAIIFLVAYSLIFIRLSDQGFIVTFWLFLVVSVNDTTAYVFGKRFGRSKILPNTSPGKTFAGSVAGAVASVLFSIIFYIGILHDKTSISGLTMFLLLSLYATFAAQLGDALQSRMKRKLKIKNMGNLIPGHGGVSDRLDSMIILAPSLALLLLFGASLF